MSITTAFAYGYGLEGAVLIGRTRGGRGRGKLGELRLAGVTLGTFAPFFFFIHRYSCHRAPCRVFYYGRIIESLPINNSLTEQNRSKSFPLLSSIPLKGLCRIVYPKPHVLYTNPAPISTTSSSNIEACTFCPP